MQSFKEYLIENVILNEDLGNLKYIKKELIVGLKYYGSNKKINAGFGRDSIVKKDIPIKKPIDVEKFVFDEPDIIASIIRINGEQSAIIAQYPSYNRFDKNSLVFGNYKDPKGKKDARIKIANGNYQSTYEDEKSIASFKKWLKGMIKKEMPDGTIETNKVSVDLIYIDKKRMQKRIDRLNQKIGAIALMKPDEVRKKIRDEMQKKLDKLKVSKVDVEANSPEDLKKIINKSIPKSIKMKGYVYNLEGLYRFDDAIFNAINGNKNNVYEPEIQYRLSRSEEKRKNVEYSKIRDEIKKLSEDDQERKILENIKEKLAKNAFDVVMEIDKNLKFTAKEIKFRDF